MIVDLACLVLLGLVAELFGSIAGPWPGRHRLGGRSARALPFRLLTTLSGFGAMLVLVGRPDRAAIAVAGSILALAVGSNVKRRVLGEPLLFTDFAIVGEMVRHPGFYLGAVSGLARLALLSTALLASVGLGAQLLDGARGSIWLRIGGMGLAVACWPTMRWLGGRGPWRGLMVAPDIDRDMATHGLLATLSVYWLRWRGQPDPAVAAMEPIVSGPSLVVVVQSESFADPQRLGQEPALRCPRLPSLVRARARAVRQGRLSVAGFGAYTMRTEYGVLFGEDEASLGFRRFDPFLTAMSAAATALPRRLAPWISRALFVHPHDLGFYGRDRLMPAIGFDEIVGHDGFADAARRGPHVSDAAVGDRLIALMEAATEPTLLYAVTIENHGPWTAGRRRPGQDALDSYLDHLVAGDALLGRLIDWLDAKDRDAVLVFFGDHRPSIPRWSVPGRLRDTPFVLLRFGSDRPDGSEPEELTPAQLHHALLDEIRRPRG